MKSKELWLIAFVLILAGALARGVSYIPNYEFFLQISYVLFVLSFIPTPFAIMAWKKEGVI